MAEDPVMGGPVLSGTDQLTPDLSWPAYPVPGLGEVVVPPGWPLVLAWDGSPCSALLTAWPAGTLWRSPILGMSMSGRCWTA